MRQDLESLSQGSELHGDIIYHKPPTRSAMALSEAAPIEGRALRARCERVGGGKIVMVSWDEVQHYVNWLSEGTSQSYRLLS
jgi:hypothetical protein